MKKGMPATSPRGASNNYLLLTKNVKYLDRLGYIRFPFLTMYRQNIRIMPLSSCVLAVIINTSFLFCLPTCNRQT